MTSKIRSIAIDFGNTNTLVALALDDGSKQPLHLPEIAQLDAQLTTDPEHPYSYVPSEIFHSEWGRNHCRAWAKIQQDDTPEALSDMEEISNVLYSNRSKMQHDLRTQKPPSEQRRLYCRTLQTHSE